MAERNTTVQAMEESKLSLIQDMTALTQELAQFFESNKENEKKTEYHDDLNNQLRVELQQSHATIEELGRELAQVEAVSKDPGVLWDDSQQSSAEAATTDLLQIKVVELSSKVKKLKKGLFGGQERKLKIRSSQSSGFENTDETVDVDDKSTMSESSSRRLLKERNDAISSLVKQAVGHDKIISELGRRWKFFIPKSQVRLTAMLPQTLKQYSSSRKKPRYLRVK
jgi:hypothetical protein